MPQSVWLNSNDPEGFPLANAWKDAIRNDPWGPIFEIMGQPSNVNALSQYPQGHFNLGPTLKTAYSGFSIDLGTIVEMDVFTLDTWHFRAFPIKKTDDLGKRTMTKVIFGVSPFDPSAPYAIARHFSYREESREFAMSDKLLGVKFHGDLLRHGKDAAQMIFRSSMMQQSYNAIFTLGMSAITEALFYKSIFAHMVRDTTFPDSSAVMEQYSNTLFLGNRSQTAILELGGTVRKIRDDTGGDYPQYVVMPAGSREQFCFSVPNNFDVSKYGTIAERVLALGAAAFTTVAGVICIEERAIPIHMLGKAMWDPLTSTVVIGGACVIGPEYIWTSDTTDHNTAAMMSPKCFDFAGDASDTVVPIMKIIRADQYMDPITGELRYKMLDDIGKNRTRYAERFGFAYPVTANGDSVVDLHIFFDQHKQYHIARYLAQTDLYFRTPGFFGKAGAVNAQRYKEDEGKNAIRDIRALIDCANEMRDQSVPPSKTEPSAIEAMAVAVASYYQNVGNGNGTQFAVGLTPGNAYGSDNLPPLFEQNGEHYIGTVLKLASRLEEDARRAYEAPFDEHNDNDPFRFPVLGADLPEVAIPEPYVRPIYAIIDDATDYNDTKSAISYTAIRRGPLVAAPPSASSLSSSIPDAGSRLIAQPGPAVLVGTKVAAPDLPPGFSSAASLYYLANLMESRGSAAVSWTRNRGGAEEKFKQIARGIRAYNRLFDRLFAVHGGTPGREHTYNLLMRGDTVPAYQRPSNGGSEDYLARIAFLQQAILGFQVPLAVANLVSVTGTSAQGPAVAQFSYLFGGAYDGRPQTTVNPRDSSQFNTTAHVGRLVAALTPNTTNRTATRAFHNLLNIQSGITPDLRADLLSQDGRNFAAALRAMVDRSGESTLFDSPAADAGNTLFEKMLKQPHASFAVNVNSSVLDLLASEQPGHVELGARYLSMLWNVAVKNSANLDITRETLEDFASRSRQPKRGANVLDSISQFSAQQVGTSRTGQIPTTYRITRLSVGNIWKKDPRRAASLLIRPANPFDATHSVMAPYIAGSNNIAANGAPYDHADGSVNAGIQTLRNLGRAEIRAPSTGFGPSSLYVPADRNSSGKQDNQANKISTHDRAVGKSMMINPGSGNDEVANRNTIDLAGQVNRPTHAHVGANFGDLPLSSGLLAYTAHSPWLVHTFHELEQVVDPIARAFGAAIAGSVPTVRFFEQCVHANWVLPRQYVLINAFIQLKVGNSIWINDNVGITEYTMPNTLVSWDHKIDQVEVRSDFKSGTYVLNEKNLTNIPGIFIRGYNGGGGSKFIRSGSFFGAPNQQGSTDSQYDADWRNPIQGKDRMVWAFGIDGVQLPDPFSLTGVFNMSGFRNAKLDNGLDARLAQTPFAVAMNLMTNFHQVAKGKLDPQKDSANAFDMMFGPPNKMLPSTHPIFRGRTSTYNKATQTWSNLKHWTGPLAGMLSGRGTVLNGRPGLLTQAPTTIYTNAETVNVGQA